MRALARLGVAAAVLAVSTAAIAVTTRADAADTPAPVTVVSKDFEDGTVQGFAGRGAEVLAAGTDQAHGGAHSLSVTGRTATWNGPALDVLGTFQKGVSYTISAWVRMAEGTDEARLSVERHLADTAAYETVVGNTAVGSAGWVNLTGRYTLSTEADALKFYVETAATTGSLFLDDVTVSYTPAVPIQTGIPSVKDVVTEFPVGAAITGAEILGEHGQLLSKHFASVTPGNALKWDATEPTEGTFTYTQADPLIAYAKTNGLAIRGHTLVWHNQTPSWVFQRADGTAMTGTAEDKALLLSRLEKHIRAVGGHYGDAIGTWDVVNEVIDESQADGMRRSPWYTVTGLDYIRTAFKVAREVLPGAKLCVNDYNTTVPAKRDALYALVAELKGEGVPIDCVGHQMHINVNWPSTADTEAAIAKFVPLGVTQQITEMDVSVYTADGESFPAPPADRLLAQAYKYRDMFALFREYASAISSVTLWGLADDNTWLDTFPVTRKDAPLLFDTALQAKPAYWGVVDPSRIGTATPASPPVTRSSASGNPTGNPTDWPPSPSTSSGTTACSVAYRVVATWPGGFLADVKLTNTGTAPYLNWYVSWQFGAGQTIAQLWNGSLTETGNGAIVRNTPWNGQVAAGASVSFGFLGSWTGSNPVPTAFGSNGKSCTIA